MTRFIYTLLLYILLPITPIKLLLRGIKQPEYRLHWGERFGWYGATKANTSKSTIWLHCVSVGETRAAEPLVKALLSRYPQHQILLSHTTPTGRATSEALFGNTIKRVYLPYDLPFAVTRFLNHFTPVVGVLLETELWFNLIAECKKQAIPLLLVNARMSEKSFAGYQKFPQLVNQGLSALSAIAAQTKQDAMRLQQLGAHNVCILGNLKFDVIPPDYATKQGQELRKLLGVHRSVFLAASTRANSDQCEEDLILQAITMANIPNLLTIIVPRHPQRFNEVAALLAKHGLNFERKSALTKAILPGTKILLGDTMGEMFTYYAVCDVAFIGGSLLALGGQNLIEASAMGKPVLIGPHTYNFEQATQLAISTGAALRVKDASHLSVTLSDLLNDTKESSDKRKRMTTAAIEFTQKETGATQRIVELLANYVK